MRTKAHLCLAVTFFCLFAARVEAREFAFDFSAQRIDGASAIVRAFALGDTINLSLPEGQPSLALTLVSESQGFGGMRVYSARIGHGPIASSVLVSGDAIYIEARDLDAGVLHKAAIRNGETSVSSVDLSSVCRGECIEVETPAETEPSTGVRPRLMASNPFDDVVVAPAPVTIDMMLVFENGARNWISTQVAYGGSITNFAAMQIAKMNQILENTGLHTNFWFRLVDIMSLDTTMTAITSDSTTTLKNGADSGEGPYGEVKTRRDACGADCVSLIIDTGKNYGTTGIGYITKGTNREAWATAFREWCYSVCAVRSVADSYTLSHEVGHNMGLTHSKTLSGWSKSTFDYANGYNFTDKSGKKYHTVMAYDNDNAPDGTKIVGYAETPYYSSPDYTLEDGTPVGSETANATLALRQTCAYIARWRDTKIPMPSDVLFSVAPTDTFIQPLEVELSNVGDFPMHYTLDGSEPTPESPLYSGPLKLTTATTVKAVAVVDENNTTGAVATASYSPAVEAAQYLKLTTLSDSWKNGDWRDENGDPFSGSMFFMANDKTAFLMPTCDVEVDTAVNLGTLVLAGETPFRVTTSRNLVASTLDVVGDATLSGVSYAFANWKLHPGSSLVLSPGVGQTLTYTNNISLSDASASFIISNGTVTATVAGSGNGCFGNATLRIASGGTLVIGGNGWKTGFQNSSPFIIDSNATMRVDSVESIHRPLTLAGGTIDINCQGSSGRALDFYGLSISVTDNSEIKATNSKGNIAIRDSDVSIDVSPEKLLLISAGIVDGGSGLQSNERGIVKKGDGNLRFTREPKHSGATTINAGTVAIGFSSTLASGTGWTVKSGATLNIEDGCALAVPSLTLESGAMLVLPATNAAPLSATNEVNLSGVRLSLDGASDFSQGKAYPLVSSSVGFAGVSGIVTDGLPALADGLMWKAEVDGGTLYAKVVRDVLNIPMGETVNLSDVPSSVVSVTGEGTLLCNGDLTSDRLAVLRGYVTNGGWKGTVAFTNYAATTLPLDWYGNASSTVRLTDVSGYPGNSGNTNIYFHTTVELVDGAGGTPAWTLNNGFSTDCTFIDRLRGDGTLKSTLSPSKTYVRQGFVVADASGFTGSLDLVGTQFTFGGTARKNDSAQTGTIYIDVGYSVTNVASWKADGLVVNGELVKKGILTFDNSVVFGNGASLVVDSLPVGGVVLTSKTIMTNGVLSVGVIGDPRSYIATVVDNGDSTVSLVFEKAPLPETVNTSISVRYWGADGWEDRAMAFNLPTAWATNYYPSLDTPEAVAAKYNETAANGATVWQCYMLGLDPTNAASAVSLSMAVADGKIRFAIEGLGETHALAGIKVYWYMKASTNLVSEASAWATRDSALGLSPTFGDHPMPDKPTAGATQPVDKLFYKLTVTFVAEDE